MLYFVVDVNFVIPVYYIWMTQGICYIRKTRKTRSNVLEILKLGSSKEISRIGLQLMFPDALFPFAFIYKDEVFLSSVTLSFLLVFSPYLFYLIASFKTVSWNYNMSDVFSWMQSTSTSVDHLLLYTLTVSGVAYLIRLRNNFDYGTSSLVPSNEILGYNTQFDPHYEAITTVAASEGCLSIGRSDGSIGCYQLGALDPSNPGL